MSNDAELKKLLLKQLPDVHERFAALMQGRMKTADSEEVQRYFGMLTKLVEKLEDDDMSMRDVLREMAAEYAAVILMELNRG
jgi:hypothetical protein